MQVKPGYKRSDLGPIPEDWDAIPLGRISDCLIGLTYSPFDVRDFGTLVLRSSNIQGGRLAFDDCVYVEMEVPPRAITRKNDILICVRNGSRQLIGKCALIDESTAGSAFGAFMSVLRSESAKFLFFQFQSDILKRQINEVMGATINQITNRDMASFKVIWPPTIAEQEAIAEALSDADALIESLDQFIAKKRQIKRGAMQELLTGKRRLPGFSGERLTKSLGDLGEFLKGAGVRKDEALTGDLPCIRYGEIYTKHSDWIREFQSWISTAVAATATRISYGDVLFAASGETKEEIGKCVAYVGQREAYAGGDIVILRTKIANPLFLGYYLNTEPVRQQKSSRGQGDAVVHIGANSLAAIKVGLPSMEEQTAIAAVLKDMDTELAALDARLAKARQIKQGMMQELLTGRIRLL